MSTEETPKKPLEVLTDIERNITQLDECLTKIMMKQGGIERLNDGFTKKTMLYSDEHKEQLKFQSSLLDNEKHYLSGLKKVFINKFSGDLYGLSAAISMLATSITMLEIAGDDKAEALKKVITVKRVQEVNFKTMLPVVQAICQNLEFIKTYLTSFDTHISSIHQKLKTENYHCHNVESHITHKRQQISLEYDRYALTLNLHMDYYNRLSHNIATQMAHMNLLTFCVE